MPGGGSGLGSGDANQEAEGILAAIRAAISNWMNLESVGDRDANSRFNYDETNMIEDLIGDDLLFQDMRDGSFWFDQNGNGTVETQFWLDSQGRIWYDINNDGNRDTIIPVG